ncbi:EAL domain-containing protein [Diaphorobacter sp.]|uniref:putative bifunctional diguanylate cyclase/phosphodiesterase n=1 Tax=Diaphorobacter sp. TaxID=1934310 RepID=UPI003D0B2298
MLPAQCFDAVWQGLDLAAWLVNPQTLQVICANEAAARLVGRDIGDMQGMPVQELAATPEDLVFWSQSAQEIAAGIHSHTTVRNQRRDALVLVDRRVRCVPAVAGAPESPQVLLLTMSDRTEQEASRRELEALLAELRATLDSAADGVLTCDLHGKVRAFNQRLAQIWQLPPELLLQRDDAAIWAHMQAQLHDSGAYRARMTAIAQEPMHATTDILHLRNGMTVEQRSVPQLIQGRPAGRVYSYRDISRQAEIQAGLRLAARVFESSLDAIFIADERHAVVRINPGCEQLLGVTTAVVAGLQAASLFAHEHGSDVFMAEVRRAWAQEGFWEGELSLLQRDAKQCPVQLSWVALSDDSGVTVQTIGFMRDLTSQRAAQKRIEELAYNDALTGLPNRLLLNRTLAQAIDAARSHGQGFAILFLDLDRFKLVNDSLGHPFGDRVLKLVAQRLQDILRQSDALYRLGGDEFVIYLHRADAAVAESVARRVLDEMLRPFVLDDMDFTIQCSIGVSLYPQDAEQLDDLIKQADMAMYRVKERGRGNFGFYQPQMSANLLPRIKMEHAMRHALGQGHMAVHYQPQVDMTTGRIVGAEALARWTDPHLGAVSPGTFVPLAEESGYIVTLGAWVMEQAVKEAADWRRRGHSLAVSVNVSALEFRQAGFVDRITGLLHKYGLPAHLLELELTESVLLQEAHEMQQVLAALADRGLRLSIDDFGTGYSSLAYLKKLVIHRLKIDKSFVDGLPHGEGDCAIVRAIVSMGRALRIGVVAEGVETHAQSLLLKQMGCDSYQGFLCAPAVQSDQLLALAANHAAPVSL